MTSGTHRSRTTTTRKAYVGAGAGASAAPALAFTRLQSTLPTPSHGTYQHKTKGHQEEEHARRHASQCPPHLLASHGTAAAGAAGRAVYYVWGGEGRVTFSANLDRDTTESRTLSRSLLTLGVGALGFFSLHITSYMHGITILLCSVKRVRISSGQRNTIASACIEALRPGSFLPSREHKRRK